MTSTDPQFEKAAHSETPQDWYITFGMGHPNAGCYTVIHGTWENARLEAFRRYGQKWAFQYDIHGWVRDGVSQAERWNLKKIDC